ncbi:MAG TPA: sialate O-acetylesterase, partial [Armatimonadota bacterium]|nr:sialate O-acetylesterase [Armatimonadota bacterium]
MRVYAWTLLALTCCSAVLAEVRLPTLFSDGMVLQRNAPVPVWGWAAPGEAVTITLDQQQVTATTDAAGAWKTTLKPMKAGGPFAMTVAGKNTLTIKDVLIGEVWVCSGQSNMEWTVNRAANAQQEMAAAAYPQMRMFTVAKQVADVPRAECAGRWAVCTPQAAGAFSAVGYFYARALHEKLQVPIGMIHTSWGGTIAEAWTSREALAASPELAGIISAADTATER